LFSEVQYFRGIIIMYIIPAIDLVGGKCVRLIQGEYHRQITYKLDPQKQAQDFIEAGAEWLHIVDLEGAKVGKCVNIDAIKSILSLGKLRIELGGGIREEAMISELLNLGVRRVIIGTKAVNDFDWFSEMAEKFRGRLVLALDVRGSKVATDGWTIDHPQNLLEFAAKAAKLPLAAIIYTDINRDGMMAGPNFERTKAVADAVDVPVIAAGGVREKDDIIKLKELGGIEAVIVGRALYEGTLDLAEAINAAK
jgi:phosphoribosylformimino-5-aminoimidazole carboxamide ribotide isomerase